MNILRKDKLSSIIDRSGPRWTGVTQATQHLLGPVERHEIEAGGIPLERQAHQDRRANFEVSGEMARHFRAHRAQSLPLSGDPALNCVDGAAALRQRALDLVHIIPIQTGQRGRCLFK